MHPTRRSRMNNADTASWGTLSVIPRFACKLVPDRPVYVWRPPTPGPYQTLYMHDGEKVFRSEAPGLFNWRVPESMHQLWETHGKKPPLVVAIGATDNRAGEYMPQKAVTGPNAAGFVAAHRERVYVPCSDAYLTFITEELIPWVESEFPVYAGRAHTAMCGCSRAGLLSIYALCEYPEVFGSVACLSTHWPHGDGMVIDWLEEHLPRAGGHRIYFDYGDQGLDADYEPYQIRMDRLMERRGYQRGEKWQTLFFAGDGHDELFWGRRFHKPVSFLYAGRNRADHGEEHRR